MSTCEWYGRDKFTRKLEEGIQRKLLHSGSCIERNNYVKRRSLAVDTSDILKGYASAVASLSIFDPSLVLVHKICRIIREYVK